MAAWQSKRTRGPVGLEATARHKRIAGGRPSRQAAAYQQQHEDHTGHHSLSEDISAALEEQWDNVPRRALEAIAVEGYRTGALTEAQVRRLLELET
jgi:hypothetical protein